MNPYITSIHILSSISNQICPLCPWTYTDASYLHSCMFPSPLLVISGSLKDLSFSQNNEHLLFPSLFLSNLIISIHVKILVWKTIPLLHQWIEIQTVTFAQKTFPCMTFALYVNIGPFQKNKHAPNLWKKRFGHKQKITPWYYQTTTLQMFPPPFPLMSRLLPFQKSTGREAQVWKEMSITVILIHVNIRFEHTEMIYTFIDGLFI